MLPLALAAVKYKLVPSARSLVLVGILYSVLPSLENFQLSEPSSHLIYVLALDPLSTNTCELALGEPTVPYCSVMLRSSTNKSTTVSEFILPVTSRLPPILTLPVAVKLVAPVNVPCAALVFAVVVKLALASRPFASINVFTSAFVKLFVAAGVKSNTPVELSYVNEPLPLGEFVVRLILLLTLAGVKYKFVVPSVKSSVVLPENIALSSTLIWPFASKFIGDTFEKCANTSA